MAKCEKIRGKKRKVCIGDMNKLIDIQVRTLEPPSTAFDYDINLTTIDQVFAMIHTASGAISGEAFFDGSNVERFVTHMIYIRFRTDVTAETWIKFNDEFYDILNVENLDENNEFLLLKCNVRGSVNKSTTRI